MRTSFVRYVSPTPRHTSFRKERAIVGAARGRSASAIPDLELIHPGVSDLNRETPFGQATARASSASSSRTCTARIRGRLRSASRGPAACDARLANRRCATTGGSRLAFVLTRGSDPTMSWPLGSGDAPQRTPPAAASTRREATVGHGPDRAVGGGRRADPRKPCHHTLRPGLCACNSRRDRRAASSGDQRRERTDHPRSASSAGPDGSSLGTNPRAPATRDHPAALAAVAAGCQHDGGSIRLAG